MPLPQRQLLPLIQDPSVGIVMATCSALRFRKRDLRRHTSLMVSRFKMGADPDEPHCSMISLYGLMEDSKGPEKFFFVVQFCSWSYDCKSINPRMDIVYGFLIGKIRVRSHHVTRWLQSFVQVHLILLSLHFLLPSLHPHLYHSTSNQLVLSSRCSVEGWAR